MTIKIPFGLKEDRLWFVTAVENGNACGCLCPDCLRPLQARNNPSNYTRPYFAHIAGSDCIYNGMTDIHRMAQQILLEEKQIELPEFHAIPSIRLKDGSWLYGNEVSLRSKVFFAETSSLEHRENNYIADVVYGSNEGELLVEVAATHFVGELKTEKVVNANRPMIEINLSALDSEILFDREAFRAVVINPGERAKWINNPEGNFLVEQEKERLKEEKDRRNIGIEQSQLIEKKRKSTQQAKQNSLEKRRQEERGKILSELAILESSRSLEWQSERRQRLNAQRHVHFDIEETERVYELPIIDVEVFGDWIFETARANWQALVLNILMNNRHTLIPVNKLKQQVVRQFGVIAFMEKLNIVKQQEKRKGRERGKAYADYGCWYLKRFENSSIISPFLPITKYIDHLCFIQLATRNKEACQTLYTSTDEYAKDLLRKEQQRREAVQQSIIERQISAEAKERSKEGLRRLIEQRENYLTAADERVLRESDGKGSRCLRCKMSRLANEDLCPFCRFSEKEARSLDEVEFAKVLYRYRSNGIPRESVKNCTEIDTACIQTYLRELIQT